MTIQKKIVFSIVLATAFFFAACGDSSSSSGPENDNQVIESVSSAAEITSSSEEVVFSSSVKESSSNSKVKSSSSDEINSSETKAESSSSEISSISSSNLASSSSEKTLLKDPFTLTEENGKKTLTVNDVTVLKNILDTLTVEGTLTLVLQDDSLSSKSEKTLWDTFTTATYTNKGYDIELEVNVSLDSMPDYGLCPAKENKTFTRITLADNANIKPVNLIHCLALKEIVACPNKSENCALKSVDGILYNADMTQLIFYPSQKEGESFSIPEGVTDITLAFWENKFLKHIEFPSTLEKIGIQAFCKTALDSIIIPSTVKTIGTGAFFGSLSYVQLNEGLETIDEGAFKSSSFKDVSIPSTVTKIGEAAFAYNSNLTAIHMKSEIPCSTASNMLSFSKNATIYVPKGTQSKYSISPGWYEMSVPIRDEE